MPPGGAHGSPKSLPSSPQTLSPLPPYIGMEQEDTRTISLSNLPPPSPARAGLFFLNPNPNRGQGLQSLLRPPPQGGGGAAGGAVVRRGAAEAALPGTGALPVAPGACSDGRTSGGRGGGGAPVRNQRQKAGGRRPSVPGPSIFRCASSST